MFHFLFQAAPVTSLPQRESPPHDVISCLPKFSRQHHAGSRRPDASPTSTPAPQHESANSERATTTSDSAQPLIIWLRRSDCDASSSLDRVSNDAERQRLSTHTQCRNPERSFAQKNEFGQRQIGPENLTKICRSKNRSIFLIFFLFFTRTVQG